MPKRSEKTRPLSRTSKGMFSSAKARSSHDTGRKLSRSLTGRASSPGTRGSFVRNRTFSRASSDERRSSAKTASVPKRRNSTSKGRGSDRAASYGTVRRLAPIAAGLAVLCLVVAVFLTLCTRQEIPEGPALPAYITDDMVEAALDMQSEYGHPAGCTIAQIIQESGAGDTPSALAARDHNLFGMKWDDYFADKPGVVGPVNWDTNEEYDGQIVGMSGTFIAFTDDVACIKFRSSVFLQSERYRTNPTIQEAIKTGSSVTMAQGLADAGWATDSSYADSLIALMDEYDLYRFDK